jgi:CheY-like chemotaxis protein
MKVAVESANDMGPNLTEDFSNQFLPNSRSTALPGPILLADGNENDVFLFRRALEDTGLLTPLFAVSTGQEAVDYLSGEGSYSDRKQFPLPSLLVLDVNTPLLNGFDVLAWLKARSGLDHIPVVMLSASQSHQESSRPQVVKADEFNLKPFDFEGLTDLIRDVHNRWVVA